MTWDFEFVHHCINIPCWSYSSFFLDLTDNQSRARYISRFCFSISSGSLVSLFVIKHCLTICVSEFVFLLVLGFFLLSTNVSVSACETPTNLPSINADILQMTDGQNWRNWGSREDWYRVVRGLPRYLPRGCYRCGTSGIYVWAKLTLLLINMW